MTGKPDVAVVGAGVMGCGTAYWLRKAGCKVLVLEKEAIAVGAPGVSAAMWRNISPSARKAQGDKQWELAYSMECRTPIEMFDPSRFGPVE